jgi:hypothetical protein
VAEDVDAGFAWLASLPFPRPLVWQTYIVRRRIWYGILCILLLFFAVGIPLFYGLQQMEMSATMDKIRPNQIAVSLGAMLVVSYVLFVHSLFKQYDDLKWVGERGELTEANIYAVFENQRKLVINYRFWDDAGCAREREAIIDIDPNHPMANLTPGMVVPLLYDPLKPNHRNYLWAEASTYLVEKRGAPSERGYTREHHA